MALADEQIDRCWHDGDWFSTESRVRQLFSCGYAAALATLPGLGGDRARAVRLGGDMYDEYARPRHWTMYPDVVPTLSALVDAGIALGVVSDWGRDLEGLLLELGLGRHFGSVVVSARMGVCKPDPTAFRLALDRLGQAPESAIHVGDSYAKDVLGAKAAGIIPVLVDRDGGAPDVDCPRIDSLSGLLGLVGLGAPLRERRGA